MFKPVRVVATVLLFASIVMTFVSAFVLPALLCIVFVAVQYLAFLWVSIFTSPDACVLRVWVVQSKLHPVCADASQVVGRDEVIYYHAMDMCMIPTKTTCRHPIPSLHPSSHTACQTFPLQFQPPHSKSWSALSPSAFAVVSSPSSSSSRALPHSHHDPTAFSSSLFSASHPRISAKVGRSRE